MSFFENTRKPVGFGGKIMVAMMNVGHSAVARWGLRFLELAPDASASSTCGYNSPICSLWETVRISPRTVAAAKEAPRFGIKSYFSKS